MHGEGGNVVIYNWTNIAREMKSIKDLRNWFSGKWILKFNFDCRSEKTNDLIQKRTFPSDLYNRMSDSRLESQNSIISKGLL